MSYREHIGKVLLYDSPDESCSISAYVVDAIMAAGKEAVVVESMKRYQKTNSDKKGWVQDIGGRVVLYPSVMENVKFLSPDSIRQLCAEDEDLFLEVISDCFESSSAIKLTFDST